MDPSADDGVESPLWAFARHRALNRLALRTKLKVTSVGGTDRSDPLAGYRVFAQANCYDEGHGGTLLPGVPVAHNQTAASCAALCTANSACDCVTYQARTGQSGQREDVRSCWQRGGCESSRFERDELAGCYDVYVKRGAARGALAYLKHDALGPHGDAAVVIFNPGEEMTVTMDLSSLPPALLAAKLVTRDLFTNATGAPLAANWTAHMGAGSFAAFGFRLGVFAPRAGKFDRCAADDAYSAPSTATTLQACFLDCARDLRCANVFVTAKRMPRWLEQPTPIACTLLGAISSPNASCPKAGSGTLVAALRGSRPL